MEEVVEERNGTRLDIAVWKEAESGYQPSQGEHTMDQKTPAPRPPVHLYLYFHMRKPKSPNIQ